MADSSSSGGFPWTSVAVLAAFVASTQLVPHAFEALRPPEKERAQATVEAELPIDARLWEDPFTALRRYEAERNERCDKRYKDNTQLEACKSVAANSQLPDNIVRRLGTAEPGETLVLAALVPGNPFVGAEEARRRTRYAMLAGLQAVGFVPDDAEHMGLLALQRKQLISSPVLPVAPSSAFNVPYELLRFSGADELRHLRPALKRYQRVLLLWVDESALPQPKLDAFALMMTQLFGEWACRRFTNKDDTASAMSTSTGLPGLPGLAVVGPSSTDALRVALADLDRASETANKYGDNNPDQGLSAKGKCLARRLAVQRQPNDLELGYWQLAHARFYSAASTAPTKFLPELGAEKDIDDFLTHQFAGVTDPVFGNKAGGKVSFVRTITTDTELLGRLLTELTYRLPAGVKRRVVLVTERDSLYAQALLRDLSARLNVKPDTKQNPLAPILIPEPVYYFRGIDGVTTRDTSVGSGDRKVGKDSADAQRNIEWPEARDQLDYLRRIAQNLEQSESDSRQIPIGAIGVLGFDVHDKLLVMQALHDNFADRIIFTTDMDARLLHPRALPFTRNLIVASSLPLKMPRPKGKDGEPEALDLRAGGAPFRDVYQSATYLAARQASCLDKPCIAKELEAADDMLSKPKLYEIGRTRPVPLGSEGRALNVGRAVRGQGLVAGLLLGTVLLGLLLWPSTPALRRVRARLVRFDDDEEDSERLSRFAVLLASLHLGMLAYIYTSVMEFLNPGSIAAWKIGLLVLAVLAPCVLAMRPGLRRHRRMSGGVYYLLTLLAAAGLVLLVWRHQSMLSCVDCEPVAWFEGVSAWPSHLLHLLALVFIVGSIDMAWEHGLHTLDQDNEWLGMGKASSARELQRKPGWLASLPRISVLRWSRPVGYSCDVERLWQEYLLRGGGRPRALRTLLAFALTTLTGVALFWALGTGGLGWGESRIFEIPVRGHAHRLIVFSAFALILILLPLAVLAVADAILLAFRFVSHLNSGRSIYPDACLQRFARTLGDPARAELWCQRIACEPQLRSDADARRCHSLLDDWIDMQLVARRTEHISPLVMGPFIVLGIVLLARSHMFDNWSMTPVIALAISAYLLVLIVLSALLKRAVESTRSHALAHMTADLRWLKGQSGPQGELAKPFESLVDEVKNMRSGAFAGVFDQPLLKAMLVPLGGAGGAQVLDYLSLVY